MSRREWSNDDPDLSAYDATFAPTAFRVCRLHDCTVLEALSVALLFIPGNYRKGHARLIYGLTGEKPSYWTLIQSSHRAARKLCAHSSAGLDLVLRVYDLTQP